MKKRVSFYTLGCKLNYSETSSIREEFVNQGYSVVEFGDQADICVVNTCTVTENAEKDCRQVVRKILRNNPKTFITITGCYAQLRSEEISQIKGVDAVLGSNEKFEIFNILSDFEKKDSSSIFVSDKEDLNIFNSSFSSENDSRTRAFFKIQDGCDYKCTYCTIPLARGESRSLDSDLVINQFKSLIDSGYKEIILTGVNVGDYGNSNNNSLFHLLQRLIKIKGEFRIRISSIEPNLLTEDIISLASESEKICNHFHIPLQSGSDKILRLMKRRYKSIDYQNVVDKLSSKINSVGIGVDVITGFPGETENDFRDTYDFIKDLDVSYLHVFTYSERPDTESILIPDKVDVSERKTRNKMLRILSDKKKNIFYRSMIGKELDVLFEKNNHQGYMRGFSSNYVRVQAEYNDDLVNKIKNIKINSVKNNVCQAQLFTSKVGTI